MRQKTLIIVAILLSILIVPISCQKEKERCWTIYIEAFGMQETRLFWGTVDEVTAEAKTLREASKTKGIEASIYYEPNDWQKSYCNK